MSDLPDYQIPISIQAITLASLPIDIVAQTVGNIAIDIAAQSVGNINVNISGQAANVNVNIAASGVTLNVNVTNSTITVTGTVSISGTVTVAGTVAISGTVTVTGTVAVSGTVTVTGSVSVTGTVTVTGTVAVSGTVTVAGSVTVSGTVGISGTVTITGTVSISGTVTITGAVTITSGTINIQTSGGTNIVIDQLTQGAYTVRNVTISNEAGSASWIAPTGNDRWGKFYPRGCRGWLWALGIYSRDSGASGGTIYVYMSPYPSAGYLYSGTITVAAGGAADRRYLELNKMWNYDSMFIWVYTSSAQIQVAYDVGTGDSYYSADAGVIFGASSTWKMWFSAHMFGLSIGDLPISGTVNTIELPNTLSDMAYVQQADINGGTTANLLAITYGMGKLAGLQGRFYSSVGTVEFTQQILGIVIDGTTFEIDMNSLALSLYDQVKTISPFSLVYIDATTRNIAFALNVPIKFRRSLRIYARNGDVAGEKFTARAIYIVEKAV